MQSDECVCPQEADESLYTTYWCLCVCEKVFVYKKRRRRRHKVAMRRHPNPNVCTRSSQMARRHARTPFLCLCLVLFLARRVRVCLSIFRIIIIRLDLDGACDSQLKYTEKTHLCACARVRVSPLPLCYCTDATVRDLISRVRASACPRVCAPPVRCFFVLVVAPPSPHNPSSRPSSFSRR